MLCSHLLPPSAVRLVFVLDLSQWGNVDDAGEITLRRPMNIFDQRSCQYASDARCASLKPSLPDRSLGYISSSALGCENRETRLQTFPRIRPVKPCLPKFLADGYPSGVATSVSLKKFPACGYAMRHLCQASGFHQWKSSYRSSWQISSPSILPLERILH